MPDVLIIEDHLEMGKALIGVFRMDGRSAVHVDSGEAAIDYLKGTVPRLILLDYAMPGMNGMQVLRALRADPRTRDIPVVVYSAMLDQALNEELLGAGANACWRKSSLSVAELLDSASIYFN